MVNYKKIEISFVDTESSSECSSQFNLFNHSDGDCGQLVICEGKLQAKLSWLDRLFALPRKCLTDNGLVGTSFNFVNSIVGSGVIGMPFAFSQAGVGMSIVLFGLVGFLTDRSILLLITSGNNVGASSYQELVKITLGKFGFLFLTLIQFLYPFISLVSYNIILGDTISKVVMRLFLLSSESWFANRHFVICVVSLLVTIPLSLLKEISKLAKTSLLSCLILVVVLIAMVIRMFPMQNRIRPNHSSWTMPPKSFIGVTDSFSIMVFAFMCHHNSFLIFNSMITPTIKRWSKVVHTSVFCSILISSFFGLIGFLTFAQSTQGDIFENYCHKDDLINVIRLLYAMIIMFSYPLESFVCRDVITNALAKSRHVDNIFIHVGVTLAIALSTILFSFLTDCLGVVLEINGSLIATTLGYIIPSMCAIKINYSRENSTLKGFLLPITILLIGLVVFISGMHSVLHKIMKNELKCSHGNEMFYCKTLNSTMY